MATDQVTPSSKPTQTVDRVVIRFAGDSGDGVQTIGDQLGLSSAVAGNDIATLPDFPAEIRAPAGTVYGVSGFQLQFGAEATLTAGDQPDVLVAFNPAALKRHLPDLPEGQVLIEAEAVRHAAMQIHAGLCPSCGGSGPVDVHASHRIYSLILFSSWRSVPRISCRACGFRRQLHGLCISLVAGWWGLPWGLLMTPVQLVRNAVGMASPPDPMAPSEALRQHVRLGLAEQSLADEKPEI